MSDAIEAQVVRSEVVDGSTGEIVPVTRMDALEEFRGPGGIMLAQQIAQELKDVVRKQDLAVTLDGRQYLKIEAWLFLAGRCGYVSRTRWTKWEDEGYDAYAEIVRGSDGVVIGGGESRCDMSETLTKRDGRVIKRWKERHACKSMAQTRASSKACASMFRWIPVMAGYAGTPYEEMPTDSAGRGVSRGHGDSGDAGLAAPRPAGPTRREQDSQKRAEAPPVTEGGGQMLTDEMRALPWINERLGFGKKAPEMTWGQMAEGTLESGRVNYLKWIAHEMEPKGQRMTEVRDRASALLGMIEKREEDRIRAMQDQAAEEPF